MNLIKWKNWKDIYLRMISTAGRDMGNIESGGVWHGTGGGAKSDVGLDRNPVDAKKT